MAQGYARSDILKKPTTMSPTITVPVRTSSVAAGAAAPSATSTATPIDDSSQAPYPGTYRRVKAFLKTVLKAELDLEPDLQKRIVKELGQKATVEKFRRQLLAYARGEYPFNAPMREGMRTIDWWRELEYHVHGHVLAVSSS